MLMLKLALECYLSLRSAHIVLGSNTSLCFQILFDARNVFHRKVTAEMFCLGRSAPRIKLFIQSTTVEVDDLSRDGSNGDASLS